MAAVIVPRYSAGPPRPTPEPIDREGEVLREEIVLAKQAFKAAIAEGTKEAVRRAHLEAKHADASRNLAALWRDFRAVGHRFRDQEPIDVAKIDPVLIPVRSREWTERVFRLARAYWSLPYSKGYGRRLRFVVYDQGHDAVIGILGLQSAPADLACRDRLFEGEEKLAWLNSTMDAYTVGAVPPYNDLLGGKLVAGMLSTTDIRRHYWAAYASRTSILRQERSQQPLLAVTTASAFGRSSIYNRLRCGDRLLAEPLGFTKGYGIVHLEALYPRIEAWLARRGEQVPAGFGNGPKVRWQNIQIAAHRLGLGSHVLAHGLGREVFLFRHAANLVPASVGKELPQLFGLSAERWASYWLEAYALPRHRRRPESTAGSGRAAVEQALRAFDSAVTT
ncbi:MAG: DUF4338 domain-containing protein [Rhodanobacteraceae bacterium]|nr:DUF4338 domain-containing protein [Rhodanobacteraceae bacterium]